MNFFPFHIGDYAAHTRNLSLMEDLAYRRLLDAYYLAERPLDGCAADVARSIGMRDHIESVEYVLGKFFEQKDGAWVNTRADIEIERFKVKSEQASRAGKASAERRNNARSTPVHESSSDVQLPITHYPLPITQEPIKKTARGSRLPENFEPDFVFAVDAGIQNTLEEAAKFRDYWNSQPGQKGVKLDWAATWRNWCRNVKPSSKVQQSSETPYQRSMREKYQTIAPSIAAQNPNTPRIDVNTFFDTLPAKKLEITNG